MSGRTIQVGRPLGDGGGLCAHAQRRSTVPSCSDGVKSADSIVRQSAAHALGQLQAKEAVHELIALLKDEDADVRKSAAYALGQYESNILVSGSLCL